MSKDQKNANFLYSAEEIADFFVYLSSKEMVDENTPEGISPLKIQKLLYFAQAASLSLFKKRVFSEEIQAWKYGPVVPTVYHKYKNFNNNLITSPEGIYISIDTDTAQLLKGIWDLFGKYSASELVQITHNHAPWKNVYEEGNNVPISIESLKNYYQNIFELSDEENG